MTPYLHAPLVKRVARLKRCEALRDGLALASLITGLVALALWLA